MNLGSVMLLNINDRPVGCLTNNTLSETINFIRTGGTTEKGAITSLPFLYGYSILFECIMVTDSSLMDYKTLQTYLRERTKIDWSIINSETNQGDAGQAFIENLQLTASTEDFIKFTGTLTGYGSIVDTEKIYRVWYGAPDRPVDEQSKYVFIDAGN